MTAMTLSRLFPALPDDARCWIYAAAQPLTATERSALLDALRTFFEGWSSHGRPVTGTADVLEDRFLIVAATLASGDISGCGIDAAAREVEATAGRLGVAWLSPLQVFFRDAGGAVQSLPRSVFRQHVRTGAVHAETPVFDVGLTSLGQVRSGAFEKPAGQSWHARVFRISLPTA